jgi:glycosyltransferase involved in cell wall biosynthesis
VGIVGRLVAVKNHALLFEAVARLRDQVTQPQVNVLVAGAGPLREELEQLAERLDLRGKVAFLGQVNQMPELYGAIDLLAMTSNSEGDTDGDPREHGLRCARVGDAGWRYSRPGGRW